MKLTTRITAAALAALALVGAAQAAPSPSTTSITATGTQAGAAGAIVHRQELAVAWALDAGEYACAIKVGGVEGETTDALSPAATSWSGAIGATPGTTIQITLSYVAIPAGVIVNPADACFRPRSSATTTATAQAWTPPAPEPAPIAPIAAPLPVAPIVDPEVIAALEARIAALEAENAELRARIAALEEGSSTNEAVRLANAIDDAS